MSETETATVTETAWQTNLKAHNIVQFMNNYYISFINQSNEPSSSLINLWFFCISSNNISTNNIGISISRNLCRLIDRPSFSAANNCVCKAVKKDGEREKKGEEGKWVAREEKEKKLTLKHLATLIWFNALISTTQQQQQQQLTEGANTTTATATTITNTHTHTHHHNINKRNLRASEASRLKPQKVCYAYSQNPRSGLVWSKDDVARNVAQRVRFAWCQLVGFFG